MGFFSNLFGKGKQPDPPPAPVEAAAAKPSALARPPIDFISPILGVPGVIGALAAMKRGDRSEVEKLYAGTRDSGLRYGLARELVDRAPALDGPATPFDAAANDGDPMWQAVRGMYHVKIGWNARGGNTADKVTETGWNTLGKRCDLAVSALEQAATMRPDDDLPHVFMMFAARGLSDKTLGNQAYENAISRVPNSWGAASQRVEWLSPRWFGSRETLTAFASAESARVGQGELAGLPCLAHNDINIFLLMFEEDREAAAAAREAAAAEIRDCLARSVDAPGAVTTYATSIIRHMGGALLWQVADEDGAKAQLSKVGDIYEPWCWMQSLKQYTSVRQRLGI
jgi:hypothetical protein